MSLQPPRHRIKSWATQLRPRLKIIIPRSKREEGHGGEATEFRITHSPDRSARTVSAGDDAVPTDEECVEYLLALRRQRGGGGGRGGRSASAYKWPQIDGTLLGHKATRASGGDRSSMVTGTTAVQSPGSSVRGDQPGDEAEMTSALALAGDYCCSPGRDSIARDYKYQHDKPRKTTVPIAQFPTNQPNVEGGGLSPPPLIRRPQPDPDMGRSPASTTSTSRNTKIPDRSQKSLPLLPPETESDTDGEDEVYGDWAEYYFDDANFRDLDGEGRRHLGNAAALF